MRELMKPDPAVESSATANRTSLAVPPIALPPLALKQQQSQSLVQLQQQQSMESDVFQTESSFTCYGKPSGYYESEWCNVFYRCVDGKRIDTRCGTGGNGDLHYDLWWEHQNVSYDPLNPVVFLGPDDEAKCEWPCRVKCEKKVWSAPGQVLESSFILAKDKEIHFDCGQQINLNNLNKYMNSNNKVILTFNLTFNFVNTFNLKLI